jgi:hypothetical protein
LDRDAATVADLDEFPGFKAVECFSDAGAIDPELFCELSFRGQLVAGLVLIGDDGSANGAADLVSDTGSVDRLEADEVTSCVQGNWPGGPTS